MENVRQQYPHCACAPRVALTTALGLAIALTTALGLAIALTTVETAFTIVSSRDHLFDSTIDIK